LESRRLHAWSPSSRGPWEGHESQDAVRGTYRSPTRSSSRLSFSTCFLIHGLALVAPRGAKKNEWGPLHGSTNKAYQRIYSIGRTRGRRARWCLSTYAHLQSRTDFRTIARNPHLLSFPKGFNTIASSRRPLSQRRLVNTCTDLIQHPWPTSSAASSGEVVSVTGDNR